ncbi:hypothetical protein BDN72DRAFT_836440 [Pluteus cervinus]|uniref:Uncharacterized protein n=1 Tax=Pluteus cervinus TaxID=181527 RepID=A0ACD3B1W7_9AGAR|nr:hypothetical protein BDN72DRAFT_836440 [Pluteus cervinus]
MMSSPQPATLLSLPNELLLDIFRRLPDLENELICLGQVCRRLNSLCIPLYLERQGIGLRNLVEDGERLNSHRTLSEDAAFPNMYSLTLARHKDLILSSPHQKHSVFHAFILNLHEIPCRSSSENSNTLPIANLSSQFHHSGNASASTSTIHRVHFCFDPSNLQYLLRTFSRVEYFLRHRHIRTNMVSLYNLQPSGALVKGDIVTLYNVPGCGLVIDRADMSQWLRGVTGLLDAIVESGCRTFWIDSGGARTTVYYDLWTPPIHDKYINLISTRMRAALPKFGFRLPFRQREGQRDPPATAPTTLTTAGPARPIEEGGRKFSPLRSPSGSWTYKPSKNKRDQPIIAEMSKSAQQACRLTHLIISTPILIVPPMSNWLFALLRSPTCPLTKLAFTRITESSTWRWESFFESLEACLLLREKAFKSANGQILAGSSVLKELWIVRCHGIRRGPILKLLSSMNGMETIKLEVLRLETLDLRPPEPGPKLEIPNYPSDPRFTHSSILLPAAREIKFVPELPYLTSLTIPSNWAHDFPFQSNPTHLRTLYIQIQGEINSSQFWLEGGGAKLANILPLYPPSKGALLGLHIRLPNPFLPYNPQDGKMSDAETLLRANICPLIRCLFLDETSWRSVWRTDDEALSETWLRMFPNLTHIKVGIPIYQQQDQKQSAEIRLKTLFGGSETLKTVEFEGKVYDRESWKEAVERLDISLPTGPNH